VKHLNKTYGSSGRGNTRDLNIAAVEIERKNGIETQMLKRARAWNDFLQSLPPDVSVL
jgi:hypothetical protein